MLHRNVWLSVRYLFVSQTIQGCSEGEHKAPGILNAYQDDFFTFAENVTLDTPVQVKYMSDANHIWRYGYPDRENITSYDKVQILTHRLHGVSRDMITLKTISPL